MTSAAKPNYLPEVREQYEQFPYPLRNPEDEKNRLEYSHSGALDVMNHYHYAGQRDFSKDFRVLIAGGGTGDAAIMMAEQLRGTQADIVYVDLSTASMAVAQERAKVRELDNITWIHGSLLDLKALNIGVFDYIDCSGVLHHLENPEAGLASLKSVMKDDGLLGIMVYARYGREMVYRIQRLMRMLNADEPDMQKRVENCKKLLKNMPYSALLGESEAAFNYEIEHCGDSGVYDLFLHSHDVAYTIPELYQFVGSADLKLSHLFFSRDEKGNALYHPEHYIFDPSMQALFAVMSKEDQQATAEILHGKMVKHVFYATKKSHKQAVPTIENLNLVPYLNMTLGDQPSTYALLHRMFEGREVGTPMSVKASGFEAHFTYTPYAQHLFKYLDGKRTLGEILKAVRMDVKEKDRPDLSALHQEFKTIYAAFNRLDWMLLKTPGLPAMRSVNQIILDTQAKYKESAV